MNGNSTVSWNQFLAFSPLYAASHPAENIFWPGCAAMKLAPELLLQTFRALGEEIPPLGFSSWCCGSPTNALGSAAQREKLQNRLTAHFENLGVLRLYTLCPNCLHTLGKRTDIEVFSAWPVLARYAKRHLLKTGVFNERYILHDPCAARADTASHQAAREILAARGTDYIEFVHNGPDARCCGRKNMLFLTDPPAAQKLLGTRLDESGGLPVVTYCESCVEAFRAGGHRAIHLLEILFDKPAHRSIFNRIKSAHRKDFHA